MKHKTMKKIILIIYEFLFITIQFLVGIIPPLAIFFLPLYLIKYFIFPNLPFHFLLIIIGFLALIYEWLKKNKNKKDEDKSEYYDL